MTMTTSTGSWACWALRWTNRTAATLLVALALAGSGCGTAESRRPAAAGRPLVFPSASAANALSTTAAFVTACTPRDGGTPESEQAAIWLYKRLSQSGVTVTLDRFTDPTPEGPKPFVNVVATIPGASDRWVVLLSHFDTKCGIRPAFQGANDSGSSTGLLLELAVLLQRAMPLRDNVLCAFLDGEECRITYNDHDGFHGSKRLAHELKKKGTAIRAVILMDMIGDCDLKITMPHNGTGALRALALEAADKTGDRDHIGLFDGAIFDDHQAFLDRGYPAVDLIDFDYGSAPGVNDYWHTAQDTLDKLSAESLGATGRIVMEMLNRL